MSKELKNMDNAANDNVSPIYLAVAKACFNAGWFNHLPAEERAAILSRGNYAEIEALIGAETSITTAVAKTFEVFKLEGNQEAYLRYALHGEELPTIGDCPAVKYAGDITEEAFPGLVLDVLAAIHDQWVTDNAQKFFDPARQDKVFMFAPLPLIGWKTVALGLIFLQPVLDDLFGMNPDDPGDFQLAYQGRVAEFQSKLLHSPMELGKTYPWGMPSAERLSDAILAGLKDGAYYPILPQEIVTALVGDATPEGWIASQDLRLRYAAQIYLHTLEDNG